MSSVGIFEKWMLNDVDSILMKMFEMLIPLSLSPRQRDFSAVRGLSDQTFWIYTPNFKLATRVQHVPHIRIERFFGDLGDLFLFRVV